MGFVNESNCQLNASLEFLQEVLRGLSKRMRHTKQERFQDTKTVNLVLLFRKCAV